VDDELSDREVEVVKLIAAGTSNKIIAIQLSLAETTVKTHVQNILVKLGANDRTRAVTIAIKKRIYRVRLAALRPRQAAPVGQRCAQRRARPRGRCTD
jgi:DNA-binding CsgD family transcriptional regulator